MRLIISVGLCVSAIALAADSPARAAARVKNDVGMEALGRRELEAATEAFAAAVKADPSWALPPYNQACAMALQYATDRCGIDRDEALRLLETSIGLDGKRKKRLLEDRDLTSLRRALRFHVLAGRAFDNPKDVSAMLREVAWFGEPTPGVFGPSGGITFKANTFTAWTLEFVDDVPTRPKVSGTWRVDGADVVLQLEGRELRGTLRERGLSFPGLGDFRDEADECGA
ncbi:MAG: hypothetical protein Q8L48_23120 [Archangium sp.]|nr:hypothetical protein [Archangium sp.]